MSKENKKEQERDIPRLLARIFAVLVFLAGFGIFIYPTVSDQWNDYRQSLLISSYKASVAEMTPEDFSAEWEKARNYNETILHNSFTADAFGGEGEVLQGTPYWDMLNLNGDGVMGVINIPSIDQSLPIYHGTSEDVLQLAVGHLSGCTLPVGGLGTHSVLAAHRGLPTAKLFSDLDQLVVGDKFYLHILDETLAYQVDQILPMVDKDDLEYLSQVLDVVPGEDHVTLFTCTPYGVNSHRLLVRGTRVEYIGEDEDEELTPAQTMVKSIQDYYTLYGIMIAGLLIIIYLLITALRKALKNKKSANDPEVPPRE